MAECSNQQAQLNAMQPPTLFEQVCAERDRLRAALQEIANCPSHECARDPFLCKSWAREALAGSPDEPM
jgi:hypothetical protein